MAVHKLKTWPEYMSAIKGCVKTFEVRENDRGFAVGDTLVLEEWDNIKNRYTGHFAEVEVTYLLNGGQFGLKSGYCAMAIRLINFDLLPQKNNQ